jgi:hypothetical protein
LRKVVHVVDVAVLLPCLYLAVRVMGLWLARWDYPFDLEWMEGGMLVHAWRIHHGLPVYAEPTPDWIPFIYPPGYSAVVALLGFVFPLGPPLARAVSIVSTLMAAAAVLFAGVRHGRSWTGGVLGACFFLMLYDSSGAFYDLIRPDGLAVALTGWALVLGLERDRRATLVAGFLLAAAFTVKHNVALFGLPMALGIWADRGWRRGLAFAAASALPAGAFTVAMEVVTGGHFVSWIVGVPGAHPSVVGRFYPGMFLELGRHFGWLCLPLLAAFVAASVRGRSRLGHTLIAAGTVLGSLAGLYLCWNIEEVHAAAGWGGRLSYFRQLVSYGGEQAFVLCGGAFGAGVAVLVDAVRGRVQEGQAVLPGRWVYGTGVAFTAFVAAALMRAHHGGFTNVYIPLHFCTALAVATALGRVRLAWGNPLVATLVVFPVAFQIQVLDDDLRPGRLLPVAEDVAAGELFVAAIAERCGEGPVLSPTNPWLAVLAGHEPSWHVMALWDIQHPKSPYVGQVAAIDAAVEDHHWSCVVMPKGRPLAHGLPKSYREAHRPGFVQRVPGRPGPPTFVPRTGWRARPGSIWLPRKRR